MPCWEDSTSPEPVEPINSPDVEALQQIHPAGDCSGPLHGLASHAAHSSGFCQKPIHPTVLGRHLSCWPSEPLSGSVQAAKSFPIFFSCVIKNDTDGEPVKPHHRDEQKPERRV